MAAQIFGPRLSWIRPARTNEAAKQTIAIVNTHDVSARFQPNSFSSGRTNTLQAYNDPSARFIQMPPMTGSHRFMINPLFFVPKMTPDRAGRRYKRVIMFQGGALSKHGRKSPLAQGPGLNAHGSRPHRKPKYNHVFRPTR